MKTVTEHIRDHLVGAQSRRLPPLDELRRSEWCHEFEQLMRNRLILGAFRYGLFSDPDKTAWRIIDSIGTRLEAYDRDGNLEHLVDGANLLMLEYLKGIRCGKSLRPVDDSPHHVEREP